MINKKTSIAIKMDINHFSFFISGSFIINRINWITDQLLLYWHELNKKSGLFSVFALSTMSFRIDEILWLYPIKILPAWQVTGIK